MHNLVKDIIAMEWNEFQKVNNQYGRAACQDNWPQFQIYRRSHFSALNQTILESYHQDLVEAIHNGRNLLTENMPA